MDDQVIHTVFDTLDMMFESANDHEKEELNRQIQLLLKNI